MRHAPSVIHPVGRSSFLARLLIVLAVIGLLMILAWLASAGNTGSVWAVAGTSLLAWVLWCVWAFSVWRRSPVGRLEWRAGEPEVAGWYWHAMARDTGIPLDGAPVQTLELPGVVLVRFPGFWLWLEEASGRQTWWPLRRALKACQERS